MLHARRSLPQHAPESAMILNVDGTVPKGAADSSARPVEAQVLETLAHMAIDCSVALPSTTRSSKGCASSSSAGASSSPSDRGGTSQENGKLFLNVSSQDSDDERCSRRPRRANRRTSCRAKTWTPPPKSTTTACP